MINQRLAKRYARALGAAIQDSAELKSAAAVLRALQSAFDGDKDIRCVITHPGLPLKERKEALQAVLRQQEAPEPAIRFLNMLLERNRMGLLSEIISQFDHALDDRFNYAAATITTAAPLTDELRTRLHKAIEKFTGRSVRLECNVDMSIVGGIMVSLWGVLLDFSLRNRLQGLKNSLLAEEISTHEH